MKRDVRRSLLRNSAVYGAFAAFLLWLILFQDLTVGDFGRFLPYLPEQMASTSIRIILLPLLVSLSIFYVARLFSAAFEGAFNEVLVGSLYATGFAAFIALALILSPGQRMLNSLGYLFLEAFAVLVVYNSISTLSRVWKSHALKVVATSATIYIEGRIAMILINLFIGSIRAPLPTGLPEALAELLDLGFTVAAVVSILAVFKTSKTPSLSAVGGIASNFPLVIFACVAGALYFNYFRGSLMSASPGIANLSPYIEWTGICIIAAFIYARAHRKIQASIVTKTQMGDWIKHVQEVSTYKGDRFVGFTEIVDDFLERGRRERILISLAVFLHDNGVGDDKISLLLSEMINYEDAKKPVFAVRGKASSLEMENEAKRLSVLQRTINEIMPIGARGAIGLESNQRRGFGEVSEAQNPGIEGESQIPGRTQLRQTVGRDEG